MSNINKTTIILADSGLKVVIYRVNLKVRDLVLASMEMWIDKGSDLGAELEHFANQGQRSSYEDLRKRKLPLIRRSMLPAMISWTSDQEGPK